MTKVAQSNTQPFVSHIEKACETFEARVDALLSALDELAAEANALSLMKEIRLYTGLRTEQIVRVIKTQTRSAQSILNGRQ